MPDDVMSNVIFQKRGMFDKTNRHMGWNNNIRSKLPLVGDVFTCMSHQNKIICYDIRLTIEITLGIIDVEVAKEIKALSTLRKGDCVIICMYVKYVGIVPSNYSLWSP